MGSLFVEIMSWSEVWGIALPLTIMLLMKPGDPESQPLRIYIVAAFFINLFAVLISHYWRVWSWLPDNNLFLYNLHSVLRVGLFSWYFYRNGHRWLKRFCLVLVPLYAVVAIVQLFFLQEANVFSARIHAAESIVLLLLCISYFIGTVLDESNIIWMQQPSFWVCGAVSLFEAVNFLVFAFFNLFNVKDDARMSFGITLLLIFSVTYVILCLALAIVLYREGLRKRKART